jgi:hypothetical protein
MFSKWIFDKKLNLAVKIVIGEFWLPDQDRHDVQKKDAFFEMIRFFKVERVIRGSFLGINQAEIIVDGGLSGMLPACR